MSSGGPRGHYFADEAGQLVGKTVVEVRPLTPEEVSDFGWFDMEAAVAIAVIFDDGTVVVPLRDSEGNGPGVLEIARLV